MSGLECTEIMLSKINIDNLDFRIDSEYFLKYYLSLEAKLDKININKISDFAYVTDGIHTSIIFDDNSNINLLSAKSPKNNIFDLSGNKCISKNQHIENPRTRLQKNDIIISTVGTIGNVAVVDESILPANCDRHVGIIRIKNSNYLPYYVSTILNSKYGKFQSNRYTTGNVQPNLFLDKIRLIKIPYISNYFQITITDFVKKAISLLYEAKNKYKKAEQILIDELNIKIENDNNINIKSFNNSFGNSGRLDAEYYLPKYEDLQKNICKYPKKGNICSIITLQDKNITPKDNRKYKYIELANIDNIGNVIDCTEDFGANLPTRARRIVHTGDVIISSIEGSLNKCAVITEEFDGAFCSTGFFVIKSGIFTAETLLVLFKSEVLQNLMKKGCSGTILTAISKEEFEKICIPILNDNIQQKITCYIKQSKLLYNQSKLLLEVAKKSVEIAIEQNEDSALKYLEEKNNEILNLNKEVI